MVVALAFVSRRCTATSRAGVWFSIWTGAFHPAKKPQQPVCPFDSGGRNAAAKLSDKWEEFALVYNPRRAKSIYPETLIISTSDQEIKRIMHSSTSGQFIRVNHIPRSQTKYLASLKNRLCTVCEARNTEQIYLFIYLNIYQFVGSSVCLAMR